MKYLEIFSIALFVCATSLKTSASPIKKNADARGYTPILGEPAWKRDAEPEAREYTPILGEPAWK